MNGKIEEKEKKTAQLNNLHHELPQNDMIYEKYNFPIYWICWVFQILICVINVQLLIHIDEHRWWHWKTEITLQRLWMNDLEPPDDDVFCARDHIHSRQAYSAAEAAAARKKKKIKIARSRTIRLLQYHVSLRWNLQQTQRNLIAYNGGKKAGKSVIAKNREPIDRKQALLWHR